MCVFKDILSMTYILSSITSNQYNSSEKKRQTNTSQAFSYRALERKTRTCLTNKGKHTGKIDNITI